MEMVFKQALSLGYIPLSGNVLSYHTICNAGFDRISGVKINEKIFVRNNIRYDFYNNIVIYYYIKSLIRFNDFHK